MSSKAESTGVLLMAYGGPDSLEDVPAYLSDVRGGRPFSDELLAELTERYRAIGGRSPILGLTQAQAVGIAQALNADHDGAESGQTEQEFKLFVGMRHWHPYIREVVPDILSSGIDRLVAVVMAPHYSRMSVGAYLQRLDEALKEQAPERPLPVLAVESWKDQPAFIEAVRRRVVAGLEKFSEADRDEVMILYTAHSLPQRILEWGDRYPEELRESAASIAEAVGHQRWQFAFQSAGATTEPWLGPPIENVLEDLAKEGVKNVLVCPIGFVCDHVEVLYDVDIEHRGQAEELGMRLERTESLNDDPLLCQAVAAAVRERLEQSQPSEQSNQRNQSKQSEPSRPA